MRKSSSMNFLKHKLPCDLEWISQAVCWASSKAGKVGGRAWKWNLSNSHVTLQITQITISIYSTHYLNNYSKCTTILEQDESTSFDISQFFIFPSRFCISLQHCFRHPHENLSIFYSMLLIINTFYRQFSPMQCIFEYYFHRYIYFYLHPSLINGFCTLVLVEELYSIS